MVWPVSDDVVAGRGTGDGSGNQMKSIAFIIMTLLAACGVPTSGSVAGDGSGVPELAGQSYGIEPQSPRVGALLAVTRAPVAFGYADGAEAKRVAETFCTNSNRNLSPGGLGHFEGGAWLFKEGCI